MANPYRCGIGRLRRHPLQGLRRIRSFPKSSLRKQYAVSSPWVLRRELLCQQALVIVIPSVRGGRRKQPTRLQERTPGRLFSNSRRTLKLAFAGESASDAQGECGEFEVPVNVATTRFRNFKFESRLLEFYICRSPFDCKFASEVATTVCELRKSELQYRRSEVPAPRVASSFSGTSDR